MGLEAVVERLKRILNGRCYREVRCPLWLMLLTGLTIAPLSLPACDRQSPLDSASPPPSSSPIPTETATPEPTPSLSASPQTFPLLQAWQAAKLTQTLQGHSDTVQAVEFSPDGQTVASADSRIRLWKVATGTLEQTALGHPYASSTPGAAIADLAFSPSGDMLVSVANSGGRLAPAHALILWDRKTGEPLFQRNPQGNCNSVQFSWDGQLLLAACDRGIQVWDPKTGTQLFEFYERPVQTIALHPNQEIVAFVDAIAGQTGEDGNTIQLWTIVDNSAKPLRTLKGHSLDIAQLHFTANGKRLVSSSFDGTVRVWDWQTGKSVQTLNDVVDPVFSLSPDSQLIAGNFRNTVLRNLNTGEPIKSAIYTQRQGGATALAFSPDGKMIAWTGTPETFPAPVVRFWQVN